MELLLPLGTALALGLLHTFEPDHLAAVSSFVVRRPAPRAAMGYGFRWALGHGGVILLAGFILVLLRLQLPPHANHWLERVVGLSLVALGGWVLLTARAIHAHEHAHADGTVHTHVHAHPRAPAPCPPDVRAFSAAKVGHPRRHDHGHAATLMGAVHGLAGTAPAVALLPLVGMDSPGLAVAYLATFGVGTAGAMGLYALFAGLIAGRAARRSEALARGLARFAGVGTVAVGVFWLIR